jgi:hypothetical protein
MLAVDEMVSRLALSWEMQVRVLPGLNRKMVPEQVMLRVKASHKKDGVLLKDTNSSY